MSTVCIGHMIPGPQGPAGDDGTNGTNGVNAFTTTSAQFTVPAANATVAVTVASAQWMSFGQVVYIVGAGYYEVASTPADPWTAVTLENLGYDGNTAPATVIASGAKVSPGGLEGPAGAAGSGYLVAANNLSDLTNIADARTNGLGLGTAATYNLATFCLTANNLSDVADEATARVNLGIEDIATVALAASKFAARDSNDAAPEAKDITDFALTLLDDSTAAAARTTLGITSSVREKALYRQQDGAGVGSFSGAGAFETRTASWAEIYDEIGASIASGVLTVPAGTYLIQAWASVAVSAAPGAVTGHVCRIYDNTNATALAYGIPAQTADVALATSVSQIPPFTVTFAASTAIVLQSAVSATPSRVQGIASVTIAGAPVTPFAAIYLEKLT